MTPGQRFLVSTCSSRASVLASVSKRCTRRSASISGGRATSSAWRAAECAASERTAAASASATAACAASTAADERAEIGPALRVEGRELGLDRGGLGLRAGCARSACSRTALRQLIALRGEVGERAGELREGLLRARQHLVVGGDARVGAGALARVGLRLAPQRLLLGGQPLERRLRVARQPPLALDIGVELDEPLVELGDALLGAGLLALERLAGDHEALQGGGGADLGVAQRRQLGGGLDLAPGRLGLLAGARRHHPDRQILGVLGFRVLAIGRHPAQVEQGGLGLADLLGDDAVADRLLGLALERLDLAGELVDDVVEPRQVGLGGAQPQLRLVPARVQAGDAGGFLEHAPALLGLGRDDLADPALVHQRRRARAGRGVGQQDLHVAGAHLAAVDAIGRARLALDAARDVEASRAR